MNRSNTVLSGNSPSRIAFIVVNYILLALFTLVSILPLIHILSLSLSAVDAVDSGKVGLFPVDFSLTSYRFILNNTKFYSAFLVSVKRVLLGVPINLICIILIAYPLSKDKERFRRRKIYVWFFVFTMLFNGGMIPTYLIVKSTGLLDSIWALILPTAVNVFNLLILMNFFRELPKAIEESALIDGASHYTILLKIYLPLAKPALATLVLFTFVYHWNMWFDGLIYINSSAKVPLQTYLQSILTIPDIQNLTTEQMAIIGNMSRRATNSAQIVVSTVPILLVYPFLQKYYTKGLVLGSVKS
ncbi:MULTISPECIES: carbohydrate ABC transporter permease [unclassified Oceanispirochaeta]|uniref:carbohydrate ABC transporter permease n=1 Tax=unclassified Oceanispirochaeta TaxID=2635722 RepID=UPI000E08D79B|nr:MULTISPECIES: carbohydrate ABC transporter permease [unclassified Oceanispirochaeta]MBF9018916.1 carbohydrate ABC transporter permease [Oceanispirochaeta sp. M2]NPD75415.1 carbohydrate ABC transporter permease [Oceanispirochaeta sp. M1]RDG28727.1 carbohydrate ABC transporter permease [Oceanispirochaeta sp. M1]